MTDRIMTAEKYEEWLEAIQIGGVGTGRLLTRLLEHDAALRQEIERLNSKVEELQATIKYMETVRHSGRTIL